MNLYKFDTILGQYEIQQYEVISETPTGYVLENDQGTVNKKTLRNAYHKFYLSYAECVTARNKLLTSLISDKEAQIKKLKMIMKSSK